MRRPVVAITMGDPAGIGPEIVIRVLADMKVRESCDLIVVGDPKIIIRAINLLGVQLKIALVKSATEVGNDPFTVYLISTGELAEGVMVPGTLDPRCGKSAADCCLKAVEMAKAGEIDAIISTPFNKEAFHMSGFTAMDDMSFFQQCFGGPDEAFLIGEVAGLWITMVTSHVSFRAIADLITIDAVLDKIRELHRVLQAVDSTSTRIGVAALNVHSGEGGMFGQEEINIISPAIKKAKAEGYDVIGPIPADSLFPRALKGDFIGIICMYHDQANIGRKILGLKQPGVTIYLGMPIPVFTVPHGTAYDIAWKGSAKHEMLSRAVLMAAAMSSKKKNK